MTIDFYRQLAAALQQGPVAVATVIQTRGSVPREVGAHMGIDILGHSFDTIGGGAGEARVMQQSRQVLQTGVPGFVEIDLSGAPNRDIQGVCGGWMQVWVQRWQGAEAIALSRQICDRLQSGQSLTLLTPLTETGFPAIATPAAAPLTGPHLHNQTLIEPIQPPPTLLVVGAGHVGVALAQVANWMGWAIAIQDDRPNFADPQRFPSHTRVLPLPLSPRHPEAATALQQLCPPDRLYIALVTRGYLHDREGLELLWQLAPDFAPRYLGMIGSKKRVQRVFQELQQAGVAAEWLQQIHAPIGLPIGALTPEEIGISICAELIRARRR